MGLYNISREHRFSGVRADGNAWHRLQHGLSGKDGRRVASLRRLRYGRPSVPASAPPIIFYLTYKREFGIAPSERFQKIRKKGDVWRFLL